MKLLPDEQRMMQRIEKYVYIRLHCFSKQSILAPVAKIQPWWQSPQTPGWSRKEGGAIEEHAAGAMQVSE